jgi:hypothetical protein
MNQSVSDVPIFSRLGGRRITKMIARGTQIRVCLALSNIKHRTAGLKRHNESQLPHSDPILTRTYCIS